MSACAATCASVRVATRTPARACRRCVIGVAIHNVVGATTVAADSGTTTTVDVAGVTTTVDVAGGTTTVAVTGAIGTVAGDGVVCHG